MFPSRNVLRMALPAVALLLALPMAGHAQTTDTTAPTTTANLSGTAGNNGWYTSAVDVTLSATDPDDDSSTLTTTYSVDGGASQTYAGDFTVSGDGSHEVDFYSQDPAGNIEQTQSTTFNIDTTAPVISINSPSSMSYTLNQVVNADYSASDVTSGVASVSGDVAEGSPIDTSTVGSHTFTVNATDNAGNTSQISVTYTVSYGVQLLYNPWQPAKITGSSIPIKVELVDANGVNCSAPGITLTATYVKELSDSVYAPLKCAGAANPGNVFRYDPTLGGYIYNLQLKGYWPGGFALHFTVSGDSADDQAPFLVR